VGSPSSYAAFSNQLSKYASVATFNLKPNMSLAEQQQMKDSLSTYKRIIVAVTESRLASYESFLDTFTPKSPLIYVFFTASKMMLQTQKAISLASAVVLSHNARSDVEVQTAKVLFGNVTVDGRLSASIGSLFKVGAGETITPDTPYHFVPEEYGLSSTVLKKIDEIANEGLKTEAYPGCQIVVLKDGKSIYDKCFGTHTYSDNFMVRSTDMYDLASLSKTTGTLLAIMKLYDRGKINLGDKISKYLPYLRKTNKKNITIGQLLFHESGLPSGTTFYFNAIDPDSYEGTLFSDEKSEVHSVQVGEHIWANPHFKFKVGLTSIKGGPGYPIHVCDGLWMSDYFKGEVDRKIAALKMGPKRYLYSDIGFMLLKEIVENVAHTKLDVFLAKEFYRPMALQHTAYLPLRYYNVKEIIPSCVDSFIRKRTLQGYPHDESAAFVGGISGNAGLFSSAEDVARIYQMILNGGEIDGQRYLSQETCRLFTSLTSRISRRGLGFDKPDKKNAANSPCCDLAPASVYGHTGFTGTCAWVDPDNRLVYVFLSNRTYPNAWENKLHKMKIRERIQKIIYQALMR
jgi:CubicO group peptidase (beta-lactamase class C family)